MSAITSTDETPGSLAPIAARKNVPYTDALRIAGAFAVVCIHVSGDGASAIGKSPTWSWWFCMAVEALSRWAVPIFVMVSGLLLLDPAKLETPGEFYKKRLQRLAVPMVAWALFYLAWSWYYEGTRFTFWGGVYMLISGGAYYHLWFLTMLAGLYLCTPILRIVVRGLTNRQLWITTITILALDMGDAIARANNDSDFTFLFKFCPFIGLFLLGYCLGGVNRSKSAVWLGAAGWVIGGIVSIASTYFLVFHCATSSWDPDNRLFLMEDEFAPGPLIISVSVFTLFAAWYESRTVIKPSKAVATLSAASLGIYLAHPFILSILYSNDIDYQWHTVFVGVPTMIATGFIGATLLSLIMLKVPLLNRIV